MLAAVTGFLALLLTAVALPPLLARLTGGHAPRPGPQLAALAPVATLPAVAAVALAGAGAGGWGGGWGLALLLAIPALYSDRDSQRFPDRRAPAIMRLDHVLVTRAGSTVREARPVRVAGTDHHAVLAVIEFSQPAGRLTR
jgi:endonuclease/exonuclease/phosphatase family metal-dependent hydrolase